MEYLALREIKGYFRCNSSTHAVAMHFSFVFLSDCIFEERNSGNRELGVTSHKLFSGDLKAIVNNRLTLFAFLCSPRSTHWKMGKEFMQFFCVQNF